MRHMFDDMLGNLQLRQTLAEEITAHRLSHAYILEGPDGSGKHMLAYRIAASLACEHANDPAFALPCRTCAACRKILSGNSPDVIPIGRGDKATLGVEAIRSLKSDVYIAPNDLPTKIYIIEDAHLLTVQAQNALLLTLEEPPPYVLFLLLCESTAPLLETVRSRAPTRHLEPVDAADIGAHLVKTVPEAARMQKNAPSDFSEILAAADGSVGRAIALLDPKRYRPIVERRRLAREFVSLCAGGHNSAATLRHLNGMSQKRDELIGQCNEILLCLRDLLLCKQTEGAPLCFFGDREEACTLAYGFTTPTLLSLSDGIMDAIEKLRQNANVRLTLTTLAAHCGLL